MPETAATITHSNLVRIYAVAVAIPTASMLWVTPYIYRSVDVNPTFVVVYEAHLRWASLWSWQLMWIGAILSTLLVVVIRRPKPWAIIPVVAGGWPIYWWTAAFWTKYLESLAVGETYFPVAQLPAWTAWTILRLLFGVSYAVAAVRQDQTTTATQLIDHATAALRRHERTS